MPKLSVIIPVYESGPYLDRCLDSIRQQSFSDMEIICVNDGSTDDSLAILKAHEAVDSRITARQLPEMQVLIAPQGIISVSWTAMTISIRTILNQWSGWRRLMMRI